VARIVGLGATPAAVAVGDGAVWVLVRPTTQLIELDPLGNIVRRIPLSTRDRPPFTGSGPASGAAGSGAGWVVHGLAGVAKVDPRRGHVVHDTVGLGGTPPAQIAATRDGVVVSGASDAVVVRLDPVTGTVASRTASAGFRLSYWDALTLQHDALWVLD